MSTTILRADSCPKSVTNTVLATLMRQTEFCDSSRDRLSVCISGCRSHYLTLQLSVHPFLIAILVNNQSGSLRSGDFPCLV